MTWVSIQCKVRSKGILSQEDVLNDVKDAENFNPRLSEMIFATTAPRDADLQQYARSLTESNIRKGSFSVVIFSWDDIRDEISKEENLDLCYRFFEGAMINYENLGIAVSRVLRLTIGVAGKCDSTYEILLGRTPSPDAQGGKAIRYDGLSYWKGQHFIACWNDRTLDTFPTPTFASDLEQVFKSKRDAYIVAKWLTANASNFTDLLYGKEDECVCNISGEEFNEFAASFGDAEESE